MLLATLECLIYTQMRTLNYVCGCVDVCVWVNAASFVARLFGLCMLTIRNVTFMFILCGAHIGWMQLLAKLGKRKRENGKRKTENPSITLTKITFGHGLRLFHASRCCCRNSTLFRLCPCSLAGL